MTLLIGFVISIFFSADTAYSTGLVIKKCRKLFIQDNDKREHMLSGLVITLALVLICTGAVMLILSGLTLIKPIVSDIAEAVIFAMVLDTSRIIKTTKKALKSGDVDFIRLCERVAEGLNDGIIAPIAYMAVGGAPLAIVYAVSRDVHNTLCEEKNGLSRFPTRLYDILNFIPSRLSAVFAMCATRLIGYNYTDAVEIFWRDRMKSGLNSGHAKAVFAGALGIMFGKKESGFKDYVDAPSIGDDKNVCDEECVRKSLDILYIASAIAVIAGSILRFVLT